MHWRIRDISFRFGPIVVFILTIGAVAYLLSSPLGPGRSVPGFAQALTLEVGSLTPGLIDELKVRPGEEVQAGQVVATLDPRRLDQEISVLQAEIQRLESQRQADSTTALRQGLMDEHTLNEQVQSLRLALAREKEALATAQLEVAALGGQAQRLGRLRGENLATEDELSDVRLRLDMATRVVEEAPTLIALMEEQLQAAETLTSRHQRLDLGQAADPGEAEILSVERQLLLLQGLRDDLSLRAPAAGRITSIHRYPGEVLNTGEAIMSMVRTDISEVMVCLDETRAMEVELGDHARLLAQGSQTGLALEGEVVSLGPMVEELPSECRAIAALPIRGREATLHLKEAAKLLPGQRFSVRFLTQDEDGQALAAEPPSRDGAPGNAAFIKVPPPLKAITRFEASGILWRESKGEYLVVSDDTGLGGKDEHHPWLFTMDPEGNLSPEHIVIDGLAALNDLESITQGPGESIYLLASQSYSKGGKRSPHRSAFLKISTAGDSYALLNARTLAPTLEDAGADTLQALGLIDGTRPLDIEGMVSFEGALYLGLKAPLAPDGRAIIWKLSNPDGFIRGEVGAEALTLHAKVQLDAEVDGKSVPGGISDLYIDKDGALFLTSTPSTGDKGSPTGRLWRAEAEALTTGGDFEAKPVKSFPGLKPEGIAQGPKGEGLVVVFDNGDAPPQWTHIP